MEKEIKKIITIIDKNMHSFVKAQVIFADNTSIIITSRDEFSKYANILMKQKGVNNPNKLDSNILVSSYEDIIKEEETVATQIPVEPSKQPVHKPHTIKMGTAAVAIVMAIMGTGAVTWHLNKNSNPYTEITTSSNINLDSFELIISQLQDGSKKEVMGKAYQFLKESNKLGGSYKFQSIVDYMVLSGNYTGEELYNIFDNYKPDFTKLVDFTPKVVDKDGKEVVLTEKEKLALTKEATYSQEFLTGTIDFVLKADNKLEAIKLIKTITKNSDVLKALDSLEEIMNNSKTDKTSILKAMKENVEAGLTNNSNKVIEKDLLVVLTQVANDLGQNRVVFTDAVYKKYDEDELCGKIIFDTGIISGKLEQTQIQNKDKTSAELLNENNKYVTLLNLAKIQEKTTTIVRETPAIVKFESKQNNNTQNNNTQNNNINNGGQSSIVVTDKKEIEEKDLTDKQKEEFYEKVVEADEILENSKDNIFNKGKEIGMSEDSIYDETHDNYYETQTRLTYSDFNFIIEDILDIQKTELENSSIKYTQGQIKSLMNDFESGLKIGVKITIDRAVVDAKRNLAKAEEIVNNDKPTFVPVTPSTSTPESNASTPVTTPESNVSAPVVTPESN
ncbi:MAG: hypothetical protein RR359_02765, partial [Bacilli bacterium]